MAGLQGRAPSPSVSPQLQRGGRQRPSSGGPFADSFPTDFTSEAAGGWSLSSSSGDLRGAVQLMPQAQALAAGLGVGQGAVDGPGRNRQLTSAKVGGGGQSVLSLPWDHSAPSLPPRSPPHLPQGSPLSIPPSRQPTLQDFPFPFRSFKKFYLNLVPNTMRFKNQ